MKKNNIQTYNSPPAQLAIMQFNTIMDEEIIPLIEKSYKKAIDGVGEIKHPSFKIEYE